MAQPDQDRLVGSQREWARDVPLRREAGSGRQSEQVPSDQDEQDEVVEQGENEKDGRQRAERDERRTEQQRDQQSALRNEPPKGLADRSEERAQRGGVTVAATELSTLSAV